MTSYKKDAPRRSAGKEPSQQEINIEPSQQEINMLVALFKQGRYAETETLARTMTVRFPLHGFGWKAMGTAILQQGRTAEALAPLQKATDLSQGDAQLHNNLGNTLVKLDRLPEAEVSYRQALKLNPDFVEAHHNLGNTLLKLGRLSEAEASLRRALEIKPDFAEAHNNLGGILRKLGRLSEAEASYRRVLELKPDCAEAHYYLGNTIRDLGKLDDAVASYRRALELKHDFADAHYSLGEVLRNLGQLDDAVASYRRALEIKPNFAELHSNLLFLYSYHALIDPDEYLAQARNWEQACVPAQDRQAAHDRTFSRLPLAGRRLRVGYVSGDYRQHAVSYFVEQLFAHHDRARIELFAYYTHGQRDAVTERLQALAEHWVTLAGMPDTAVRDRIEADGIDVLVDLSGHTRHNRLGMFARRAAPVQAHYLGFMASTVLTEMDYWIGDEILTPPETDSHFSERVWRLPRVWVSYEGKADAPLPDWHPAQDGSVWVGSFNTLDKLTPATLALWAKVLHALPEGRLLLKTKELAYAGNRRRILDAMAGHGIPPDRVELQDRSATPGWREHMAYYDRLDIALDPVGGVGGGTTTCDALWMGVPVITLEGDRMASRMTTSMLNAIGHPEWIARSEAEYVDKVVALARNVEQRKALRPTQRDRMANSPLCDAKDLAMNLENAYVEMFERWLGRQNEQPSIVS